MAPNGYASKHLKDARVAAKTRVKQEADEEAHRLDRATLVVDLSVSPEMWMLLSRMALSVRHG